MNWVNEIYLLLGSVRREQVLFAWKIVQNSIVLIYMWQPGNAGNSDYSKLIYSTRNPQIFPAINHFILEKAIGSSGRRSWRRPLVKGIVDFLQAQPENFKKSL